MEHEDQKEETLATPGVLEKYQAAGKVANRNIFDENLDFPFLL